MSIKMCYNYSSQLLPPESNTTILKWGSQIHFCACLANGPDAIMWFFLFLSPMLPPHILITPKHGVNFQKYYFCVQEEATTVSVSREV